MVQRNFFGGGYNPPPPFYPPPRRDPRRHPDDDRMYRRPAAWRNAKRAFGVAPGDPDSGGEPGRAMVALEQFGPGCPRFMLAVAVHLFLGLPPEEQGAAVVAYCGAQDAGRAFAGGEGAVNDGH